MEQEQPTAAVVIVAVAAVLAGCTPLKLPKIDPSGERIFLPHGNYTELVRSAGVFRVFRRRRSRPLRPCRLARRPKLRPPRCPALCGAAPEPSCGVVPEPSCGASACAAPTWQPAAAPAVRGVPPRKTGASRVGADVMMAPVGSEVVILSGLADAKGEYIPRQPLEWSLTPDSVGQLSKPATNANALNTLFRQASDKRDGSYAVTRSVTQTQMLSRGTPNAADDVSVSRGQSWVTITSPTEGASFVGVVAPEAEIWDQRRQTSTIYWVDVQWVLPSPAVVLAAQPHALSTTVRRRSGKPLSGWIVRYEILDPKVTSFGPNKHNAVDVKTDENGIGSVNLVPANKSSSTQVRISIVRPSLPNDELPPMVVGQGYTSVTWSAPDPKVTLYGPESAGVGSTVTYRAEISNAGDIAARRLIASAARAGQHDVPQQRSAGASPGQHAAVGPERSAAQGNPQLDHQPPRRPKRLDPLLRPRRQRRGRRRPESHCRSVRRYAGVFLRVRA